MPSFRVVVKVSAPYPMEHTFIIKSTKAWTAANIAMRRAYDSVAHKRKIEAWSVSVKKL